MSASKKRFGVGLANIARMQAKTINRRLKGLGQAADFPDFFRKTNSKAYNLSEPHLPDNGRLYSRKKLGWDHEPQETPYVCHGL